MEYTEIIYLVQSTETKDEIGNIIPSSETLVKVYARPQMVATKEFYNAVSVGLTPTDELRIKKMNYNGESELEWNGQRYSIIRTIPKEHMDVVLVIGHKQGVNG